MHRIGPFLWLTPQQKKSASPLRCSIINKLVSVSSTHNRLWHTHTRKPQNRRAQLNDSNHASSDFKTRRVCNFRPVAKCAHSFWGRGWASQPTHAIFRNAQHISTGVHATKAHTHTHQKKCARKTRDALFSRFAFWDGKHANV